MTLQLERRGCDFFKGDPINEHSDVGNYRVFVKFIDKNGIEVCGDFSRCPVYRYHHKITGKPLKHRKFEHDYGIYAGLQYTDENNMCWGYKFPEGILSGLYYTKQNILNVVNQLSNIHYDSVEVI